MDVIKIKTLNGVIVQENGILRNSEGYLIARLTGVDFNSEHINNKNSDSITKQAMGYLSKALKEDPEYAFAWHSNITMACTDSMVDIKNQLPLDSTNSSLPTVSTMKAHLISDRSAC